MHPFNPQAAITTIKGVGPSVAQKLANLGIFTVLDAFLHLPHRYQDRTTVVPLNQVRGEQEVLVEGRVVDSTVLFGKRRSLKVSIQDDFGRVYLRFFHFTKYQQQNLSPGKFIQAYGTFKFFGKELTVAHPEYEIFDQAPETKEDCLTPVYPTTAGLTSTRLRKIIAQVCALPWHESSGTPTACLRFLHQPSAGTTPYDIEQEQAKLAFDELTTYYLIMKGRALTRQAEAATNLPQAQALGRQLLNHLGFRLTKAQARVTSEVLTDLQRNVPMLRLVQGDVGSGKTIIAAFAAIRAAEHQGQTALMAPTELLAEQHALNFINWLDPLGITVCLLTGGQTRKQQNLALEQIANGEAQIVIGTHALFQGQVEFKNLVLSIIDEQHRFGVHQRMMLKDKAQTGSSPHQLVMTATPIPRTLTMALYADMDVSVIDELPKGRKPITTQALNENKRPQLVETVHQVLSRGEQAYWVCTLIDESDEISATAATTLFSQLQAALPKHKVGLLHGRLKAEEKNALMLAFKSHQLDLLVATTVIEVGVDVPNATHMVIENSERLGLAQLHQLRGRVGRGDKASFCYLLHTNTTSEAAQTRLQAMVDSQDGFYLAEQDLKLRGPGDMLGTRQAGEQGFRIADLLLHAHLMPGVIERGESLLEAAPDSAEALEMDHLLHHWAPADEGHLTV